MSILKLVSYFVALVVLAFLLSCSKSEDSPAGPNLNVYEPIELTVSPESGLPGAVLNVTGFSINPDSLQNYAAIIGGETAPLRLSSDSLILVAVPLFFDSSTGWTNPPPDSTSLQIWEHDKLIASSGKVLKISSPPKASGTNEQIRGILDTLVTDMGLLFTSLLTPNSWEQEYRDSLMAVVQSLITGPDISLAAILNGNSSLLNGMPVDPELADAIMASAGALEYWQEYAKAFSASSGRFRKEISGAQSVGILCPSLGPDADVACQMQLYVLVHAWQTEFLAATRTEWEYSIGWIVDAIAIVPGASALPPVAVGQLIGAILTITDIVVGNVVLSLLPSHISGFDMTLASTTMNVDEFTNSQLFVTAANTPERMTLNEMIDLVMAVVGFKETTAYPQFEMIVMNIIQFIVDKLRMVYSVLHSLAPEVFGDPLLVDANYYAFPNITWGPVEVTNHDLVELFSFEPAVLEPDTAVFEWWSASCGDASIQARTRDAGERSKLVRDWLFCLGCSYNGGAFGESSAATTSHKVTVGLPGAMDVVITGLPQGQDADVLVIFPNGATFDHFKTSRTLPDLESGSYEVQANEVVASDGVTYVSDPPSWFVDITCDSTNTVDIAYTPKFGSIYLVITGLFEGEEGELPADIRIEGPNNFVLALDESTLIDSLIPGLYDVFAFEVDDNWGQTYVPEPGLIELTVERANTTTQIIAYKPKFGKINMQITNLQSDLEADIDIVGPNQYFHHVTGPGYVDSLLEGDYIINAYDIVDGGGDSISPTPLTQTVTVVPGESVTAWVDYSGGHDLTVSFAGLPLGASANVSITGPESYSASVTSDTVLTGLPHGGPYNITSADITHNGVTYRPKPADTTIFVRRDTELSLTYKGRSTMSFFLGGLRLPPNPPPNDPRAQLLVSAKSTASNPDTTITDEEYNPTRGSFPDLLIFDSCGFESGRMLIQGLYNYSATASTARGEATADITFDVHDTTATITVDATLTINPPAAGSEDVGYVSLIIDLTSLFMIEIKNPNDTFVASNAAMGVTGRFEAMKNSSQIQSSITWDQRHHLCNSSWTGITVLGKIIPEADTLQVYQSATGSQAGSGQRREIKENLTIHIGGSVRAGEQPAEATVHGTLQFLLRNF